MTKGLILISAVLLIAMNTVDAAPKKKPTPAPQPTSEAPHAVFTGGWAVLPHLVPTCKKGKGQLMFIIVGSVGRAVCATEVK